MNLTRDAAHRVRCLKSASRVATRLRAQPAEKHQREELVMIILGIILLIIGFVAKIAIVWSIGILLLIVGAILALLGFAGREVFGRRHYF
jgi:uncharacterized membrane protein HdeD (DUF308 family)